MFYLFILGIERPNKILKKSAVPSVFVWTCPKTTMRAQVRKSRCDAREARRRKLFQDITNEPADNDVGKDNENTEPEYIAYRLDLVSDDIDVGACEEVSPVDSS